MEQALRVTAERAVCLIGVESSIGGPNPGTALAAAHLRDAGIEAQLRAAGRDTHWLALLAPRIDLPRERALPHLFVELAGRVAGTIRARGMPVVLGGDHSCAIGTWRGVAAAAGQLPGLMWIDAHLDANTPASSRSGRMHGMPLAYLLGAGEDELAAAPVLDPRRCCVIGARSVERIEQGFLRRSGVRVFPMAEVARRGLAAVFAEALAIVRQGSLFGVSIDLDALDPGDAPGVGCPVAGGLALTPLLAALSNLNRCADFCALEVAEFDPMLDVAGRTEGCVAAILRAALCAQAR